jgi:hypothetical protein
VLQAQPTALVSKWRRPAVAKGCDCHQRPYGNFFIRFPYKGALDKGQRTMIFSVKGRREKVRRKTEKIPTKVRKKNVWQKIFFQTHFEQK